jgi:hypothetical protein
MRKIIDIIELLDWYDGPRAFIADFFGELSLFYWERSRKQRDFFFVIPIEIDEYHALKDGKTKPSSFVSRFDRRTVELDQDMKVRSIS